MITLYYMALSPFCRKIRMALDFKQLDYAVENYSTEVDWRDKNRRAEIPILQDAEICIVNSSHIVAYLEHRYPDNTLYPSDPSLRVKALKWERLSDTWADAIVTNIAIWMWANIGERPAGLLEASKLEIRNFYNDLEADLAEGEGPYVCGSILSIGDIALYPQISAAAFLDMPWDKTAHPNIDRWYKHMCKLPAVVQDNTVVLDWWKNRNQTSVEVAKINWGTYRLEMFMAMGFHEQMRKEIEGNRVLWSVGPQKNW